MAVASSSSFEGMVVSVAKSRFCCDELKLAAASDLFRKIFTSVRHTGARNLFVELKNFPGGAPAFKKILKFVEDQFQADHLDLHTSSFPTLCAAAKYLGMPLLASSCARFWSSQVVTTTSSIFEVLAIVTQDHGVALSAEERSEVISKCFSATLQALGRSSLHEFFVNMVTILPVGGISVLLKFLERRVDFFSMQSKVWDKARYVVLASELIFVACPTGVKARDVLHRAGILARFVLGLFREGLDYAKDQRKHWLVPSFDDHHDLHESVALLNLLALCDFLLEQDSITADTSTSDRIKAQEKKLFALLAGSDAHSKASTILLSPGSAMLLAFNFGKHHEDKKQLAVEFIEHYLQQISLTQLSREETLEICKFISAHSLSHDNLFNHVWRVVTRSTTLSRKRLQELMDTISSSKLSTEKLMEKLQERAHIRLCVEPDVDHGRGTADVKLLLSHGLEQPQGREHRAEAQGQDGDAQGGRVPTHVQ
ncbi:hypothetical protein SELMODRAFT_425024 [Selaginella moellendorffii]|uniref:Uncharacterized protein n=1 Tax=Selaginella moellendorffii TaxID=88036 RepID=D8SRS5_SELML|nr:hypothetical protein SELMODRAFT_425024 [Selaginella moellendorffii]